MKYLLASAMALTAMTSLAFAATAQPGAGSDAVKLTDQQLDAVVGGWCESRYPGMTFEGQQVYEVQHGEGAIVCSLKPNGGIPLVIFTGHRGSGQVVVIGDRGAAR